METDFTEHPGDFVRFSLEEYISFILRFLERMSPEIVIERFSGEVPPRLLAHSDWGLIRYDEVLRRIEREMDRQDTWQGKGFRG
jgi:radical SAM superfamily enzyme